MSFFSGLFGADEQKQNASSPKQLSKEELANKRLNGLESSIISPSSKSIEEPQSKVVSIHLSHIRKKHSVCDYNRSKRPTTMTIYSKWQWIYQ